MSRNHAVQCRMIRWRVAPASLMMTSRKEMPMGNYYSAEEYLRRKVEGRIARAIGQQFCIRLDRATKVRGVISRCEFAGARRVNDGWVAQAKVWLTGDNGHVWGPYVVERLPN